MQGDQLCRLLYRVEISVMQKLALCRNICHAGICVLQKYTKSMNDRTGKEERTGKMAKEPKKLALLRIWQILQQYSDKKHLLMGEISRSFKVAYYNGNFTVNILYCNDYEITWIPFYMNRRL